MSLRLLIIIFFLISNFYYSQIRPTNRELILLPNNEHSSMSDLFFDLLRPVSKFVYYKNKKDNNTLYEVEHFENKHIIKSYNKNKIVTVDSIIYFKDSTYHYYNNLTSKINHKYIYHFNKSLSEYDILKTNLLNDSLINRYRILYDNKGFVLKYKRFGMNGSCLIDLSVKVDTVLNTYTTFYEGNSIKTVFLNQFSNIDSIKTSDENEYRKYDESNRLISLKTSSDEEPKCFEIQYEDAKIYYTNGKYRYIIEKKGDDIYISSKRVKKSFLTDLLKRK